MSRERLADGAAAKRLANAVAEIPPEDEGSAAAPTRVSGPSIDCDSTVEDSSALVRWIRQAEPRGLTRFRRQLSTVAEYGLRRAFDPQTYRQIIRSWAMAGRSDEVDPFGLDPAAAESVRPLLEFLYRDYFRVEVRGSEHVPDHGRAVVVANHSGPVPYDAAMLMYALRYDHPAHRAARPLLDDAAIHAPWLGVVLNRIGAVRACPENADRLLADDQMVVVFPEGEKGRRKRFSERYRLQRFGRGGFVRIALRRGAPIVPVAVVGAEEVHPVVLRLSGPARWLGLTGLPVTPTFPWLGLLGALPLPSKWVILFGQPIDPKQVGAGGEDPQRVHRVAEQVRSAVDELLGRALSMRSSVFLG